MQDYEDRANADPRMLTYDEQWSACMSQAGYSYASSASAKDYFRSVHLEIWTATTFPASEPGVEGLMALSAAERSELYMQQPIFDVERWEAGLQEETVVATQDLKCQRNDPRSDVYATVLRDFEEQFVAENSALIEELRSAS